MSNPIQDQKEEYLPAREAALRCDLSRDYVTRLAREGKIEGRRVKNSWHVSERSLRAFCATQDIIRTTRSSTLSDKRRHEYRQNEIRRKGPIPKMHTAVNRLAAKRAVYHIRTTPLYAMHPAMDLLHRVTALVGAIAFIVGLYAFVYPPSLHLVVDLVHAVAAAVTVAVQN